MQLSVFNLFVSSLFCGAVVVGGTRNQLYESSGLENDGRTVLLGGLFPIHATSDTQACAQLQDFAIQQVEAMLFAINLVNNDPTLLPGINLTFTIRDTCSNPSYALDQTFQFIQSQNVSCFDGPSNVAVSGIVGGHFSRVSMDVANLLRLHKVPQISYISTADLLSDKTRFGYFFRTVPPDSLQARAIADIIDLFNWTYIFAIYSDDSYGRGGIDALIREVEEIGACVAATIPLSVTASSSDYREAVEQMSAEWVGNASIAVLFGHLDAAEGMMQALTEFKQGPNATKLKDLTWIGTDAWGDALPAKYHEIAHGMLSVIPLAEESRAFDCHFTNLHPSSYNENIWFNEFWESHFNCSFSDGTCNDKSLSLNTSDHKQYSHATLVVDAVLAFAHAIQSLIDSECPNGTLCDAVMDNQLTGQSIKGELIREHLYNISFQGPSTNLVTFDAQGNEPGAYFVYNLQRVSDSSKFSFERIGRWDHLNSLNISEEAIEWLASSNGSVPPSYCSDVCDGGHQPIPIAELQCCWVCSACQSSKGFSNGLSKCTDCNITHMPNPERTGCIPIVATFLKWTDAEAIVLLVVTLCGLFITIGIMIVFAVNNTHTVVKASSREVSTILLLGLLLCYLMPFAFMATPSEAICAIRRFGVGFSFAVCYSALLVKTNRIHRIFNNSFINPSKAPLYTGPISQVVLTLLLISVQVAIAVLWLAVEQPSTNIAYASRSAELRCGESPVIGISVSLGYNLLLLVFSTYFAFRARKVPENFNEAKYINVTLYTLCIVWIAFIPTYFSTAQFGAVFQTSSLTAAIILSATTTLACLFVPRIILLFTHWKEANKAASTTMTTKDPTSFSIPTGYSMTYKGPTSYSMTTKEPTSYSMTTKEPTSYSMTTKDPTMTTDEPTSYSMTTMEPTKEPANYSTTANYP